MNTPHFIHLNCPPLMVHILLTRTIDRSLCSVTKGNWGESVRGNRPPLARHIIPAPILHNEKCIAMACYVALCLPLLSPCSGRANSPE